MRLYEGRGNSVKPSRAYFAPPPGGRAPLRPRRFDRVEAGYGRTRRQRLSENPAAIFTGARIIKRDFMPEKCPALRRFRGTTFLSRASSAKRSFRSSPCSASSYLQPSALFANPSEQELNPPIPPCAFTSRAIVFGTGRSIVFSSETAYVIDK